MFRTGGIRTETAIEGAMKTIDSLLIKSILGFAVFCFFAVNDSNVRAQVISLQGLALAFENAHGIEPSAVEPIGDGTNILIADDHNAALLIVNTKTREVAKQNLPIPVVSSSPKWEAMAKDPQNNYYLIGIYAGLFRFHLKEEAETDPANIRIEGEIEKFTFNQSDEKCGSSAIEGLTIWVNDNKQEELVFGIRNDDSDTIQVCRAELTANKQLSVKPFFQFEAPKVKNAVNVRWHLSSIEYNPDWAGFLVVTSTEDRNNNFYGNMFWFVNKEQLKGSQRCAPECRFRVVSPVASEVFEPTMKAEGFAVLNSEAKTKLRGIIVFDNDYGRKSTKDAAALAVVELFKPVK